MAKDVSEKERGWLLPARNKYEFTPGLYLAATPIGNLGDITLRVLDTISGCDAVVCEDTRVSGKLLHYYGIKKPLLPYNDHNADIQRKPILDKLRRGAKIALISDAGTPLLSDPGYKLVRACIEEGIPVTSLPGANAVLTALQLSGLPLESFSFLGFLPPKREARRKKLAKLKTIPVTMVFFETAPRLAKSLADILDVFGDRDMALAREMTKLFEETRRGRVSEILNMSEREGMPKGEIVLVISGAAPQEFSDRDVETQLRRALKTMRVKEAAAFVAETAGRPKKELYDLALRMGKE